MSAKYLAERAFSAPLLKTLILSTSRLRCESEKDVGLRSFASPQTLISTVGELLNMSLYPLDHFMWWDRYIAITLHSRRICIPSVGESG